MAITNVNELIESFRKRGFYYSKDLIFNYFNSLITKPFVILTGISGSGKSKIAELFAEIVSDSGEKQYELIPVKPNWRDNKGLFGFHNLIDDSYYKTPLIGLFIRALSNPNKPYFLILDEMNIAKTEHYFADYLSLIESRRVEKQFKGLSEEQFSAFNFQNGQKLSEAIILAAIDINKPGEFLDVKDYRENRFVVRWKEQFFGGQEENWTPMFRTELNQKKDGVPSRLAGRTFESIPKPNMPTQNLYRLKNKTEIDEGDLNTLNVLEQLYKDLGGGYVDEVIQDNLVLHNSPVCLGTGCNEKCDGNECNYRVKDKYKCPKLYDESNEMYLIPPEMPIPLNLFTIGTVNVDETTYMFSPKVLDRSNVIEFNEVDFSELYNLNDEMKEILASNNLIFKNDDYYFDVEKPMPDVVITMPSRDNVDQFILTSKNEFIDLLKIFSVLKKYNMQFGYRVMNEISRYMCNVYKNTTYSERAVIAMDIQMLQKILPKFYGAYDKLWRPLIEILSLCLKTKIDWEPTIDADELRQSLGTTINVQLQSLELSKVQIEELFKYPRSATKIINMLNDLNSVGFATFIK